ncbi:hypothetical protein B0H17DRAFT_1134556 [Mycena rosella]|uniref:Uncharacterized protein n=1 Tax=Mycena rosella TaxID=1033263 RepID=A0AAD7DFN1_MYCRO|nr:hypothetical protein B0H17DRAFT_1134556 [Mycena rosella]
MFKEDTLVPSFTLLAAGECGRSAPSANRRGVLVLQAGISHMISHVKRADDTPVGSIAPSCTPPLFLPLKSPTLVVDGDMVELGGLQEMHASSAPANLVAKATAVKHGGLDEDLLTRAESMSFPQESKPLTARNLVMDNGSSVRNSLPALHPRDREVEVTQVIPSRGILKSPSPAVFNSEVAVELGRLKDFHLQLRAPDLEMLTLENAPRTNAPPSNISGTSQDMSALAAGMSNNPAPAPVLKIGLGGPKHSPSVEDQLLAPWCIEVLHTRSRISLLHHLLLPSVFPSVTVARIFALFSANIRILYLGCSLVGDITTCREWEREGIGTHRLF